MRIDTLINKLIDKARIEGRLTYNGVKVYKTWVYSKANSAFIFEGYLTKDELLELL